MHKLTDKENTFCMAICDGYSQRDAYVIAYNPTTTKENSIDVMASRIANKDYIISRINELRERKNDTINYCDINDKNKRITFIWERINACLAKNDENNVVKYIDMLNKLAGDYKNINVNENDIKPLSTMSNEDLSKLIASIEN